MKLLRNTLAIAAVLCLPFGLAANAQEEEPAHVRGEITEATDSYIVVKMRDGESKKFLTPEELTIITLAEGSFTKVEFGSYVGSVAVRLDELSPIVRDSESWLHQGFELRIIDEELRGIAAGEKKWTLPEGSIAAHGWVDDMEDRIVSIKHGPTPQEETDVEVGRDVPVLNMALAKDRSLVKPGTHIFGGAVKDEDGNDIVVFLFVGKDGIVPPL